MQWALNSETLNRTDAGTDTELQASSLLSGLRRPSNSGKLLGCFTRNTSNFTLRCLPMKMNVTNLQKNILNVSAICAKHFCHVREKRPLKLKTPLKIVKLNYVPKFLQRHLSEKTNKPKQRKQNSSKQKLNKKKKNPGTSLMVLWLRICQPMQRGHLLNPWSGKTHMPQGSWFPAN